MVITLQRLLNRGERWLFGQKRATYGLAAMRIGLGVAILGSLFVNFADRHYVWGPGSRWLAPWLVVDDWGFPFTLIFGEGDSPAVFTVKYLALGAVAVLFTLGWRTRWVTPVLLIMLASLMRLNPVATDAGDNLMRISLLFLCFADTSLRWSLDARRRERTEPRRWRGWPGRSGEDGAERPQEARPGNTGDSPGGGADPARPAGPAGQENGSRTGRMRGAWPAWPGVLFHNVALMAIAFQVFVVYVVSGLSKVQGSMWQEGVGLYYPLRIGQYAAWPALNELVYTSAFFVTVASYVTVFVQLFFPLLLMRRTTRVVALLMMFAMHVGIAITMALPWFSLAILAADAIFIRDVTYRSFMAWLRSRRRREPARPGVAARRTEPVSM